MTKHRNHDGPYIGFSLALIALAMAQPAHCAEPFPADVQAFLRSHCVRCHGDKKAQGKLNLESLMKREADLAAQFKTWKAVTERVAAREMPPAESDQPTETEREAFARWYKNRFMTGNGKPTAFRVRRLSTHEYRRTMESLFGFPLTVATTKSEQTKSESSLILKLMPPDPRGPSGYTNDTSGNPITANVWEKYAYIADAAIVRLFSDEERASLERMAGPIAAKGLSPDQAARLLDTFQTRAWRRPPGGEARARHVELTRGLAGDKLIAVLKTEMKLILMSPEFLYRGLLASTAPTGEDRMDGFELAERLSYLFWADMPDEELVEAAAAGKLSTPSGFEQQVHRLLASPKARSLAERFGTQWLELDTLDKVSNEPAYAAALKGQPVELLHDLIARNRPLLELLDTRTEFVNAYLINYYAEDLDRFPATRRRPGVELEVLPMERMELEKTTGRSGLLTLPGILTMNKDPIQRGRWVLERLLGEHIGEPPPNVPPVKPAKGGANLSFRERFAVHRANKACASCHDRIDPIGFAFDVFNESGGYRLAPNVGDQKVGKAGAKKIQTPGTMPVVDTSGVLPSGERFKDFGEFKRLLNTKLWPRVVENLVRQTLSYALCRPLQATDEPVVAELTTRLAKPGATWGDLMLGVANSGPFREATYLAP
jgi:cytochrome c553